MDITQEINKTDTLKNNLKTVTKQIKQSIVRGGGTDFKSLAETPQQIENLLGQYSKVAIINTQEYDLPSDNGNKDFKIPINIDFDPKICFLQLWPYNAPMWELREAFELITPATSYGALAFIKNSKVTKNEVSFNYKALTTVFEKSKFKIVVIG